MSAPAVAIGGEILLQGLRLIYLWKRLEAMEGKTPEQIDAEYKAKCIEFEKRPPEDLQKLIDQQP